MVQNNVISSNSSFSMGRTAATSQLSLPVILSTHPQGMVIVVFFFLRLDAHCCFLPKIQFPAGFTLLMFLPRTPSHSETGTFQEQMQPSVLYV